MIRTLRKNLQSMFFRIGKLLAKRPLGAFLILLLSGVPTSFAYAQVSAGEGIANGILEMFSRALFGLANIVMRLTVFSLQLFLELAAYNDYITSPPVIVGWFMVRDVANMFFIVVLLVIAFATVLGIEQYEWKKTLGKLVIAAILINFSKLILQLIIDIANIFTVTFLNAVRATAAGNLINMFNFDTMLQIRNNANLTGTSDFRIDIFGAAVMALVLSLMAAFVMGAYMLTLLARVVVLWVLIILSPLAFLLQAVPSAKKYADEFWSEFTKHVMVAPLMTFFLWLTFATLGNGDITSSIGINTSAVERAGANSPQIAGVDGQPSIALSQAGTWESLSNFIISIGFLVVGIMAVQRLNVQAGGIAGGAVDFGKKVATIASGYAAGRWLVGKGSGLGLDVGKGLAYRLPVVGGAAWQERYQGVRARIKQKGVIGVATGGKIKGGIEGKIKRAEAAKDLEGKAFGLGTFAARVIEPAERRAKRAKDWEEGVERLQYVLDESYGTSGTIAGQFKLEMTGRKVRQEELSSKKAEEKKVQYFKEANLLNEAYEKRVKADVTPGGAKLEKAVEDAQAEMSKHAKGTDDYKKAEVAYNKAKNKHDNYKEKRKKDILSDDKALKDIEEEVFSKLNEKQKRLIKSRGGVKARLALAQELKEKATAAAKTKAKGQVLSEEQQKEAEIAEAVQMDNILRANDETPRFENVVRQRWNKKVEEEMSAATYTEATTAPAQIAEALKDSSLSDEKRLQLMRRMVSSINFNMSKGSEQGMEALNNAMKALDIDGNLKLDDIDGHQKALLGVLLGKEGSEVQGKTREELFDEWGEQMGKDGNLFLRNLNGSLKTAAADGAVRMAGLLDDSDVQSDGTSKMKLQTNSDDAQAGRDYFAERLSINKITDVNDIFSTEKDASAAGGFKFVSDEKSKDLFVKAFKSMTPQTRLIPAVQSSLEKMKKDLGPGGWTKLLAQLEKTNEKAARALDDRIKS